jgi:hypothetical protein
VRFATPPACASDGRWHASGVHLWEDGWALHAFLRPVGGVACIRLLDGLPAREAIRRPSTAQTSVIRFPPPARSSSRAREVHRTRACGAQRLSPISAPPACIDWVDGWAWGTRLPWEGCAFSRSSGPPAALLAGSPSLRPSTIPPPAGRWVTLGCRRLCSPPMPRRSRPTVLTRRDNPRVSRALLAELSYDAGVLRDR